MAWQPNVIPAMPPDAAPPPTPGYGRPPYASRRRPELPHSQQAYTAPVLAPLPFQRNGMLVLAQLLAIVQGILALITGINLIRVDAFFNNLSPAFPVPGAVNGIFLTWGVAVVIIALLVIAAGIRAGHPSQIARWLLAVWEIVAFLTILAVVAGGGLGLGLGFLIVLAVAVSGVGFAPVYLALAIQALIIYGLVIHPATNQAFAR